MEIFWAVHHNFAMSFRNAKEFFYSRPIYAYTKIASNTDDYSCIPNWIGTGLTIRENNFYLERIKDTYITHQNFAMSFRNPKEFLLLQKHTVNHWWSLASVPNWIGSGLTINENRCHQKTCWSPKTAVVAITRFRRRLVPKRLGSANLMISFTLAPDRLPLVW